MKNLLKKINIKTVVVVLFLVLMVVAAVSLIIGLITGDLNTNPLK